MPASMSLMLVECSKTDHNFTVQEILLECVSRACTAADSCSVMFSCKLTLFLMWMKLMLLFFGACSRSALQTK